MRSDLFDFEVPPERIAQHPPAMRGGSRLMVVHREAARIEHRQFSDLGEYLNAGDVLALNNTRVRPCRLFARRKTGGHVEVFILRPLDDGSFLAMTGSAKRLKQGERLDLPTGVECELIAREGKHWRVAIHTDGPLAFIATHAKMPLPPYIRREREDDRFVDQDRERYQTVFAEVEGAVAAPTAGLHFTDAQLQALEAAGVSRAFVTLHVGLGTFAPLKADTLDEHEMHSEWFELDAVNAERLNNAARRVVVGTTSCRTLESIADETGQLRPTTGETDLFIRPGYAFKSTDALLTNFHLPRSTLIFLVAAFLGVDLTRKAYLEAIAEEYRFFSYGDAMLCLP